eukprot:11095928-Lingulodinium_polyedra.AAC.1
MDPRLQWSQDYSGARTTVGPGLQRSRVYSGRGYTTASSQAGHKSTMESRPVESSPQWSLFSLQWRLVYSGV